ncbi:hypothetical protein RCG19_08175 [Neobacillus sp. OS1-2]|uniref:hypothetical protein n=1 Tax=Neobacillus sp. OS1-2 TaxID=3070680 RepID=UPI0027DFE356|nr:hypothetical protein [Neobacillus sp. OS1-2]WML41613.1 hypothetical protein RCG19_08175 [Neobacillus sp. OS1-2]
MNFIYRLNEKELKISRSFLYFFILSLMASFVNFNTFSLSKTEHSIVTYIVSVVVLLIILTSKWFIEGLVIKGILLFSGGNLEYRQILNIIVNNQLILMICTLCLCMLSIFDNQIVSGSSGKVVKLIMQSIYMFFIFKSLLQIKQNVNRYKLLIPLLLMVIANLFI